MAQTESGERTGAYYTGSPAGMNVDVEEVGQGVGVQSYVAGFVPGPSTTRNQTVDGTNG
ncbi:hypothetical protein DEDE109153_16435 [Deinococcus deserti]|uniref:hypothetical protein n=1 Tax=Deinococcus deserti TaxID=310783 RepID=UPI000316CAE9|nr:hypothetical protein [Deinococcus deserti]